MTCKYGLSANGRERARTLPKLAMQKVVGTSPIIRFAREAPQKRGSRDANRPELGSVLGSIRLATEPGRSCPWPESGS